MAVTDTDVRVNLRIVFHYGHVLTLYMTNGKSQTRHQDPLPKDRDEHGQLVVTTWRKGEVIIKLPTHSE